MFYVVYTELWPFTCHRINQDATDQTPYPIPPWANINTVGSVFSTGWNATWCVFLHHCSRHLFNCHLSVSSNLLFWARHSQRSPERSTGFHVHPTEEELCAMWPSNKAITSGFKWNWNKKSGPLLGFSLVTWPWQPMRSSSSGSVWSLLGQSRCVNQERG